MGKVSIERNLALAALGIVGWAASGAASACSGGGEFSSRPPSGRDPDASLDSGSGGSRSSGGASSGGNMATGGNAQGGAGGASAGGTGATTSMDGGKEGGAGGSGPPPGCIRDEDCAPFICNGVPRCMDGTCGAGDPCEPIAGSDYCANECVRTESGASCVVMGKDEDGDGHRDARCETRPGDDCDDSVKERHAGADEICDGLDNDCNGKADAFDGLPLAGETRVITSVTNTARLALVRRTSGYGLFTVEMPDAYAGLGNPADARFLGFDLAPVRSFRISGHLNINDPAMAALGDDLVFFGYSTTSGGNVLTMTRRLGADGVLQAGLPASRIQASAAVWGRVVEPTPTPGRYLLAWDEQAAGGDPGGIVFAFGDENGPAQTSGYAVHLIPGSRRAMRPSTVVTGMNAFALTWAEIQPGTGDESSVHVHLTTYDAGLDNEGVVDRFSMRLAPSQYQGETVRPDIAFDGTAYTVASRGPNNGLRVVRLDKQGQILCGPTQIEGVKTWAGPGAMASTSRGVLLASTAVNGDVVIHRVAQGALTGSTDVECVVQRTAALNAPAKRVASSAAFEQNQLNVSMGDPVLLVGKDDELLVSWVERDRTPAEAQAEGVAVQSPAEVNRVVLRTLKPNLCSN